MSCWSKSAAGVDMLGVGGPRTWRDWAIFANRGSDMVADVSRISSSFKVLPLLSAKPRARPGSDIEAVCADLRAPKAVMREQAWTRLAVSRLVYAAPFAKVICGRQRDQEIVKEGQILVLPASGLCGRSTAQRYSVSTSQQCSPA